MLQEIGQMRCQNFSSKPCRVVSHSSPSLIREDCKPCCQEDRKCDIFCFPFDKISCIRPVRSCSCIPNSGYNKQRLNCCYPIPRELANYCSRSNKKKQCPPSCCKCCRPSTCSPQRKCHTCRPPRPSCPSPRRQCCFRKSTNCKCCPPCTLSPRPPCTCDRCCPPPRPRNRCQPPTSPCTCTCCTCTKEYRAPYRPSNLQCQCEKCCPPVDRCCNNGNRELQCTCCRNRSPKRCSYKVCCPPLECRPKPCYSPPAPQCRPKTCCPSFRECCSKFCYPPPDCISECPPPCSNNEACRYGTTKMKYCVCGNPRPCDCKQSKIFAACTPCCVRCGYKVYAAEKITLSKGAYHTSCFSCYCCQRSLDLKSVYEADDEIYCKRCYNMFFGTNYVGYGSSLQPC